MTERIFLAVVGGAYLLLAAWCSLRPSQTRKLLLKRLSPTDPSEKVESSITTSRAQWNKKSAKDTFNAGPVRLSKPAQIHAWQSALPRDGKDVGLEQPLRPTRCHVRRQNTAIYPTLDGTDAYAKIVSIEQERWRVPRHEHRSIYAREPREQTRDVWSVVTDSPPKDAVVNLAARIVRIGKLQGLGKLPFFLVRHRL